ncbi:major latex allergen Hev b 5-like [Lathyrus oleraceus]|uniref:major latex allergen Hev b 5-like n=1 Tax=Pisum sativum TaxID=3888 RepID=UPI0021D0B599|nr:major latex allergen Hev b 5-like [Pisum sativum]
MFNEPLSSSLSSNPSSPPYYDLTSNTKHSGLDNPDPTSPNHEELQATTDSEKTQSVPEPSKTIPEPSEQIPEPSEPIPEPSEPDLTIPTFDEGTEEKLEARMEKEAFKKAEREATAKKAAEKAAAEAATREQAEAKAALATEAAQKAAEDAEKTTEVALTQGESSTNDLAHLVIKILEELQKEQ